MDRTERIVKISLTCVIGLVLDVIFPFSKYTKLKSLFICHFLNFFLNGHPWALMNHTIRPDVIRTTHDQVETRITQLQHLGKHSDSIAVIAVYGSLARTGNNLNSNSDLNVRVVRYPGKLNGLIVSLLICRERARASLTLFPLDIYVLDTMESLNKMRDDEEPIVLVDKEDWIGHK